MTNRESWLGFIDVCCQRGEGASLFVLGVPQRRAYNRLQHAWFRLRCAQHQVCRELAPWLAHPPFAQLVQ